MLPDRVSNPALLKQMHEKNVQADLQFLCAYKISCSSNNRYVDFHKAIFMSVVFSQFLTCSGAVTSRQIKHILHSSALSLSMCGSFSV